MSFNPIVHLELTHTISLQIDLVTIHLHMAASQVTEVEEVRKIEVMKIQKYVLRKVLLGRFKMLT